MADLVFAFCYTRFKERVHVHFSQKDTITPENSLLNLVYLQLNLICRSFGFVGTSLADLIQFLDCKQGMFDTYKCPVEWSAFLCALASASPVCGLLHPSEKAINLLTKMRATCISHCPTDMEYLHKQLPVLFELMQFNTTFSDYRRSN